MLDALTNLKMEFVEEKKDLRRIEESTVCADTVDDNMRKAVRNGVAFMLVCFVLVCIWMAWNSYEVSQIQKHLKVINEQSTRTSNFDRFYADFERNGGSKALRQVSK